MSAAVEVAPPLRRGRTDVPTIWGLTPWQAYDRFWAAYGVQVVRQHDSSEVVEGVELYLLCEERTLVLFSLQLVLDTLHWMDPQALVLRLRDARPRPYREIAVTADDRLVRFERVYRDSRGRSTRVAITRNRELARAWQSAPTHESPWRWLRSQVPASRRAVRRVDSRVYDGSDDTQVMECLTDILRRWRRPDATIRRAGETRPGVWADPESVLSSTCRLEGPVWIGAGRSVDAGVVVAGPAVLWDAPDARPQVERLEWLEIEPARVASGPVTLSQSVNVPGKRAFDIAFAATALLVTAPIWPVVAAAILIEDGGPVFFAHRRESIGGREFGCMKFRSMRKQSEADKQALSAANEADGPQFFMRDDPRVTRVGRWIRRFQIDELPQFVNVLLGHMSVVGPRPSPYSENQFCPAWREARLSVRPGVTGLWQVMRTRKPGLDFQEWIRYDLEYVEKASWSLDLGILFRTIRVLFPRSS